jgi:hypothetical protein
MPPVMALVLTLPLMRVPSRSPRANATGRRMPGEAGEGDGCSHVIVADRTAIAFASCSDTVVQSAA